MSRQYDVVILTQKEYVNPLELTPYIENILLEDLLLINTLEHKGLKVIRVAWDDPDFIWESGQFAVFRAIWDYFHRYDEFQHWLSTASKKIQLINSYDVIKWNMNKYYLSFLNDKGINIPPTLFIDQGQSCSLEALVGQTNWTRLILKPAVSGGARHTYLFNREDVASYQHVFAQLVANESMLLQEFQYSIQSQGEVSFMVFAGTYSHAVLKNAAPGDFRVQDDFGGTVHAYQASTEEIAFVEQVITQCTEMPVYARVDVMRDNQQQLCLSELELIEPELWLRKSDGAAQALADAVCSYMHKHS